jgi:hypothetical protein
MVAPWSFPEKLRDRSLTKATRISWDEFLRRVNELPSDAKREIAAKAAAAIYRGGINFDVK